MKRRYTPTKLIDIAPLEFCRRIKSAYSGISFDLVVAQEDDRGIYKEYCSLLAHELNVSVETVKTKWGAGISFPGMPDKTRWMLKFILQARLLEIQSEYRSVAA